VTDFVVEGHILSTYPELYWDYHFQGNQS